MSTALIVIKNKSENSEPELTLEQREEQNSLDAYYQRKAKDGNLWSDKTDWFEAEDYHVDGITD